MVAKLKLKDFYPVLLFIVLLFMGGLVGANKPDHIASPADWSRFLDQEKTTGYCDHRSWSFLFDPSCKDSREKKIISPLFQQDDFYQRFSQLSKLTKQ